MDLDAILARSRNPGQFVERQTFTLSRSKALEKMRDFTLRTPHQFALELVQAGVFAGANWIFVDADKHATTVGWIGGRSLQRRELDRLLDYLFVAEGPNPDRHLRQIAVAVNVLMRRNPQLLRVESGDRDGCVRLDLDGKGDGVLGVPEDPMMGTYLHVRFSTPWFFETKTRSIAAELVETDCIYSPVPLFVNGTGPHGWDRRTPLSNPMSSQEVSFRGDGRDGWVGFPANAYRGYRPEIRIVVGGAIVSRRTIPELGEGVEGVIRDDQLAKTADMSDVVADERWLRMLHHVQPLVAERLTGDLPELDPLPTGEPEPEGEVTPVHPVFPKAVGLTVLGIEEPLPWTSLPGLRDEPIYWTTPEDGAALAGVLTPETFPGRVVVAREEDLPALAAAVGRRAFRVEPHEAEFVREQVLKGVEVREVAVSTDLGLLRLRLHVAGPMPGWRLQAAGLPTLIVFPDGRRTCVHAHLDLPRMSAVLELDETPEHELSGLIAAALEREIWRSALEAADPDLTRALLAQAVFLQPDGTGGHSVCLPSTWPPEADALLDLPVVPDGPSARQALATLGTHDVVDAGPHRRELLELLSPFGGGHVAGPIVPLVVMRWEEASGWRQERGAVPSDASALLFLVDGFGAPDADAGWESAPTPHPLIVARARPGLAVPWADGLDRLGWILEGAVEDHLPPGQSDCVRLARLVLRPDHARFTTADGVAVPVGALRDGRMRVCLRGGPGAPDASTVLLTADEVAVLGGDLRWRLDDPPALWTPEPDLEGWLVTANVVEDGVLGWLGLRFPYDPTGGVLLQRGLQTRVVSDVELAPRFHGWVRQTTDADPRAAVW
ncbi:MAG: hypothetical protein KC656_06510 [Myxococcales bacterium]|nr:hypothetical protein [Myxococcales bacterium]